jgi:integrase
MAKPRRLTSEYVASLSAAPLTNSGKPSYTLHDDTGRGAVSNLRLRVTSGGAKAWVLGARFPAKPRNPTLRRIGEFPAMKLDEARDIAIEWNRLIAKRIDPQEHAEAKAREERAKAELAAQVEARKRAGTFARCAETYIEQHVAELRTSKDIARVIRKDLIARWGPRPIADITKTDVIELLEYVKKRQGKFAASRAYVYASALFDWWLDREDPKKPSLGIDANPCAAVRPAKFIGKLEPRQRVLAPAEIRPLWKATTEEPFPAGPFVRLLLILGVRRLELAHATWREMDLDAGVWRLPETRVKNAEARIVPLAGLAIDILRSLPRFAGGPYIFSVSAGRTPWTSYDLGKKRIDRKIAELNNGAPIAGWRLHDLRRTMRSNLSAIPSVSPVTCEMMIGHRQRGLLRTYDLHRYEAEQRAGFEAWCARLREITEPRFDNVVELRA